MSTCPSVLGCMIKRSRTTLIIHHQRRTFLFGSPQYTKHIASGNAIEIGDNEFVLDENFSPGYNPKKDAVIRNYSSSLTQINSSHLELPFNELTQKRLFYTNFCGIIEYLPSRYLGKPYKIGDKVWGIKPHYKQPLNSYAKNVVTLSQLFGRKPNPHAHNNAWSEYLSSDIRCISHLPHNIPIEYGGLFGTDLLQIFDGFGRVNWLRTKDKIQGKKVLIIGSGRQSLINMLVPILQICGAGDITILSSHKRHNKLLAKFNVKAIIDANKFIASKHEAKYDLIVDSLSVKIDEIQKNVTCINPYQRSCEYWVIRNPTNHLLRTSETRSEGMIFILCQIFTL